MQVFADNPFPQRFYKAGIENINGKYINRKEDIAPALADGWTQQPIHSEWPKWVGPHSEEEITTMPDGKGGFYNESRVVNKGGKVCQNQREADEHLAKLGETEDAREERRGPGRPRKVATAETTAIPVPL